jgi:peptidoglycan/LPS O-acetylase OafA/YrhL
MAMIGTDKSEQHLHKRLRDFLLYIAIALLVLAAIIATTYTGLSDSSFIKIFEFFGFTALLFGYFIEDSRALWRRGAYWALAGLLLAAHSIAFAVVLTHVETFKPIWFGMIVLPEIVVFVFCRNLLLPHSNTKSNRQNSQHDDEMIR